MENKEEKYHWGNLLLRSEGEGQTAGLVGGTVPPGRVWGTGLCASPTGPCLIFIHHQTLICLPGPKQQHSP